MKMRYGLIWQNLTAEIGNLIKAADCLNVHKLQNMGYILISTLDPCCPVSFTLLDEDELYSLCLRVPYLYLTIFRTYPVAYKFLYCLVYLNSFHVSNDEA